MWYVIRLISNQLAIESRKKLFIDDDVFLWELFFRRIIFDVTLSLFRKAYNEDRCKLLS